MSLVGFYSNFASGKPVYCPQYLLLIKLGLVSFVQRADKYGKLLKLLFNWFLISGIEFKLYLNNNYPLKYFCFLDIKNYILTF